MPEAGPPRPHIGRRGSGRRPAALLSLHLRVAEVAEPLLVRALVVGFVRHEDLLRDARRRLVAVQRLDEVDADVERVVDALAMSLEEAGKA